MHIPSSRGCFVVALFLSLGLMGCLGPESVVCSDGRICSAGSVCSDVHGCLLPEQSEACIDTEEGGACSFSGVPNGRCASGACIAAGCGNGIEETEQGEVCDDGNNVSGDGCRADCGKIEVCGDAEIDMGESCDDANINAGDGCDACVATQWSARALVESTTDATAIGINSRDIALDVHGNIFIAGNESVWRLDTATGAVTAVAGNGTLGYSGDGGQATSAQIKASYIAVDGLGNVFIAGSGRVRRIETITGVITTVAGTSGSGIDGDDILATSATIGPSGLALDGLGNLFISESSAHRIRRVDGQTGIITTVVGTGVSGVSGDGGPAIDAEIMNPTAIAVDVSGTLYIADFGADQIRRVDGATGVITLIAGDGTEGFAGDGGPATSAQFSGPEGIEIDAANNVYISDSYNNRLRYVDAETGIITTLAGSGGFEFSGDEGLATVAGLKTPGGLGVDDSGSIYLVDQANFRIRKIDGGSGIITTIAGSGDEGWSGNGELSVSAPIFGCRGIHVGPDGSLYIPEQWGGRVRRVDPKGVLTTVAGAGAYDSGAWGDGGPARLAGLHSPNGVVLDSQGNLYFSEWDDHKIRRVDAVTGIIDTVAGTGTPGFSGDDGLATSAEIYEPAGLAVDANDNVFFADSVNWRVRKLDISTGIITTVAGSDSVAGPGDGGLAIEAELIYPTDVDFDAAGAMYIADSGDDRIRKVDLTTGIIETFAGTGVNGFAGDGFLATTAEFDVSHGVAIDPFGNLYIADFNNNRVRRVDAQTGIIDTVAGPNTGITGQGGQVYGDGGLAIDARINEPLHVDTDDAGNIYIPDQDENTIRRIDVATGIITTVAGQVWPQHMGPTSAARLSDPQALVHSADFTLMAGGTSGTVQGVIADTDLLIAVAGRYNHALPTGGIARYRDKYFGDVRGLAYDEVAKVFYLTESTNNRIHAVTVVDPSDPDTWTIAVLANESGDAGFADGALLDAKFRAPSGLHFDNGILYVADTGNHVIRAIDLSANSISTLAGTPETLGFFGDGEAATTALLFQPSAITRCASGDMYIADTGSHRVRRIDGLGMISTVLGDGVAASSGQGVPSSAFPVNTPNGITCDDSGNLLVTSRTTVRLVAAGDDGIVNGDGAVHTVYGGGERLTFPESVATCLTGITMTEANTALVADSCTGLLVELNRAIVP